MFELNIDTRIASVKRREKITAGSVGIQCRFAFSAEWDGLGKTAVFETDKHKISIDLSSETVTIPWEVCEEADLDVIVGVYGTNASGTIVIPTIYAKLGTVAVGTTILDADNGREPTETLVQQIMAASSNAVYTANTAKNTADDAKTIAEDVQRRADAGEFKGEKGDPGATGSQGVPGTNGRDGVDGAPGADGTSVTVESVSESTESGGTNTVTFSDGQQLRVKNGVDASDIRVCAFNVGNFSLGTSGNPAGTDEMALNFKQTFDKCDADVYLFSEWDEYFTSDKSVTSQDMFGGVAPYWSTFGGSTVSGGNYFYQKIASQYEPADEHDEFYGSSQKWHFVDMVVPVKGHDVHFMSTQCQWQNRDSRINELKRLRNYIADNNIEYFVLGGDFNFGLTVDGQPSFTVFTERTLEEIAIFKDVGHKSVQTSSYGNPQYNGFIDTYAKHYGYPLKPYDNIFYSANLELKNVFTVDYGASDHYALCADFAVKGNSGGGGGSDVTKDTVRGWGFAYTDEIPEDNTFVVTYGQTAFDDILAAYDAGKRIVCKTTVGSGYAGLFDVVTVSSSRKYIYMSACRRQAIYSVAVTKGTPDVWQTETDALQPTSNRVDAEAGITGKTTEDKYYPTVNAVIDYVDGVIGGIENGTY